jgi:hypothetical protein
MCECFYYLCMAAVLQPPVSLCNGSIHNSMFLQAHLVEDARFCAGQLAKVAKPRPVIGMLVSCEPMHFGLASLASMLAAHSRCWRGPDSVQVEFSQCDQAQAMSTAAFRDTVHSSEK